MKLDTILLEQLVREELELYLEALPLAVAGVGLGSAAMNIGASAGVRAMVPYIAREVVKRGGPTLAKRLTPKLLRLAPAQLAAWTKKALKMPLSQLIPRTLITAYGLDAIFGGDGGDGDNDDDNRNRRDRGEKPDSKAKKSKEKSKEKSKKKSKDDEEDLKRYDWWGFRTAMDAGEQLADPLPGFVKKKPKKTPKKD